MKLLIQHGLFGGGLVEINDSLLVGRYNECLVDIGETPTGLTRFEIDGRGWSPEVAAEKHNPAYLSHGGAMQYAILLTPEQKGKPVYNPYFSFERPIMAFLFRQAGDAIARITEKAGIWVQIDSGLSELKQLDDLAMIRSITVTLGDHQHLIEAAESQHKLVARFVNEPDAWTDETLRKELAASGQQFGDLRFAPSFSPEYLYTDATCFYTTAFAGAFVLRGKPSGKEFLVVDEKTLTAEDIRGPICTFGNRNLLSRLLSMGLAEVSIKWYRKNLKVLEELREGLLVATLYRDATNNIDFACLNTAQRERCVIEYRQKLPQEFSDLERLEQRLKNNDSVDVSRLSLPLRWLLVKPVDGLPPHITEMVWRLVCRVAPVRVVTRFVYDKEAFFAAYGEWPEPRKRWAVDTILASGLAPRRRT